MVTKHGRVLITGRNFSTQTPKSSFHVFVSTKEITSKVMTFYFIERALFVREILKCLYFFFCPADHCWVYRVSLIEDKSKRLWYDHVSKLEFKNKLFNILTSKKVWIATWSINRILLKETFHGRNISKKCSPETSSRSQFNFGK